MRLSAVFICFIILTQACTNISGASNSLVKEQSNNSNTKRVILFLKQAGATVADSYQVSILDMNDKFDSIATVGNVFIVDANHGEGFLRPENIRFTWINNDSLLIKYDAGLRTFLVKKNVKGVSISYQEEENVANIEN